MANEAQEEHHPPRHCGVLPRSEPLQEPADHVAERSLVMARFPKGRAVYEIDALQRPHEGADPCRAQSARPFRVDCGTIVAGAVWVVARYRPAAVYVGLAFA